MCEFHLSGQLTSYNFKTNAVIVTDTDGNIFSVEVKQQNQRIDLMRASKGALVEIAGQIVTQTKAMMSTVVSLPSFVAQQVVVRGAQNVY